MFVVSYLHKDAYRSRFTFLESLVFDGDGVVVVAELAAEELDKAVLAERAVLAREALLLACRARQVHVVAVARRNDRAAARTALADLALRQELAPVPALLLRARALALDAALVVHVQRTLETRHPCKRRCVCHLRCDLPRRLWGTALVARGLAAVVARRRA